jgi:Mg2+-importing ATPase
LALTLGVMAVGIAVPFSSVGAAVGLAAVPAAFFPWLAGTLLGYCLLTQFVKR